MNIDTPEKIFMCMVHEDNRRYVKMRYRDIVVMQRIGLEVFKMSPDRMQHTIMGLAKQAKVQMVRECVKRHYPVPQEMEICENEQALDAISDGNRGNGNPPTDDLPGHDEQSATGDRAQPGINREGIDLAETRNDLITPFDD